MAIAEGPGEALKMMIPPPILSVEDVKGWNLPAFFQESSVEPHHDLVCLANAQGSAAGAPHRVAREARHRQYRRPSAATRRYASGATPPSFWRLPKMQASAHFNYIGDPIVQGVGESHEQHAPEAAVNLGP